MLNRIKGFLYDCIGALARIGNRPVTGPRLLIVKTDEIGDFILWHNFLRELISADRFQYYEIHFCGNESWKKLFEQLYPFAVQKTYWLSKMHFKKDMLYRYTFLKKIYREHYTCVINAIYSRDKTYDDAIVLAAKAAQVIGMNSNRENLRSYQAGYDTGLYTTLFDHPQKPLFELYRNRLFTEFIIQKKSVVTDTKVDPCKLPPASGSKMPPNYFVVFPGSRNPARVWPTAFFIEVSNYLFGQYGWTAVVCGSRGDAIYTQTFLASYTHAATDLTAKTSLPELMHVLKNARCLLSVDTGSVHLAAAVGCTVFGVFNGSQYGRFAPYPREVAENMYAIYPDAVEEETKNKKTVQEKYELVVPISYSEVSPQKMIQKIQSHFQ